jgi:CRP/FNR family transcriptional regulator, cyclic AMP receptor protein
MAARKLSPKTRSNTTGVPSKRSFSGILPNLPIQFSESLLANAKPRSLAEREVLFEAGDVADGCYRLEQGLLQGDERILTILAPGSSESFCARPKISCEVMHPSAQGWSHVAR